MRRLGAVLTNQLQSLIPYAGSLLVAKLTRCLSRTLRSDNLSRDDCSRFLSRVSFSHEIKPEQVRPLFSVDLFLGAPLVGGAPVVVWYRGGRGFGGGYLPECCRTPQSGGTPLLAAASNGRAKVVGKFLAAGAARDVADEVRKDGLGRGRA